MNDINGLKNIFGKLKASDDWKNGLYERISENASRERKKRPAIKKTAAALISAAAVLALSVTAAAVTGFFDLGTVMRNKFGDDISAERIADGDYQPLDVSAENDLLSVKASAFIGDHEDCYVILEVRSKRYSDDLKGLSLGVVAYNELCEDASDIWQSSYKGEPAADENGEPTYVFKVRCPPAYVSPAAEKGAKLIFDIRSIGYERDFKGAAQDMYSRAVTDLSLSFVPDGSVIREPAEVKLAMPSRINGIDCTVERFSSTVYATKVDISYPIYKSAYSAGWELWDAGRKQGRTLLAVHEGSIELNDEFCPVKLRVDGEYVPLFADGGKAWYPPDMYVSEFGGGEYQPYEIFEIEDRDEFLAELRFEHIDFENAESIVLELKNGLDPTREITVK
ncbi:MAG: hypothetical protein NC395_09465 [Prevotella sp.]|nr:hypothetical protein [Prevotella sp.]